ncbi:hypothetical protein H257_05423 [Aphanomyces astaci]|uniref:Uncharacterized protein n=1 Tax=Aphanomyces astaci TaxID=112090 RepID=W4GQ76_APHAT|nr:hypothetical protein H257_05423 [Aphanomyces astaci]ETV81862.1 hypothetical protein H257_05423 [Aphanomyces astaci]|eukprot:XP_009828599.1 hypothetical protein H257_05423 [Aphanomyces astaci]
MTWFDRIDHVDKEACPVCLEPVETPLDTIEPPCIRFCAWERCHMSSTSALSSSRARCVDTTNPIHLARLAQVLELSVTEYCSHSKRVAAVVVASVHLRQEWCAP